MALVHIDSFDHYASADAGLKGWTLVAGWSINAATGRRSSASLRAATSGNAATLIPIGTPSGATMICGFAYTVSVVTARDPIFRVYNGAVVHTTIALNADGSLTAKRAGTTSLGSSAAGDIVAGVTNYLEIKITIDDAAGVVIVKKNGTPIINLTSQDTRNADTAAWTKIEFLGTSSVQTNDLDDLYLCDGSGSVNNDFLGDVRVDAHYPTANGNTSNSTPSTGTNRGTTVDETAPNGDTDYNTVAATNDKDTLVLTDLIPTGSAILGISTHAWAKKTDAGIGSLAIVTRSGGADTDGTAVSLTTGYTYLHEIRQVDPATSAQWIEANFNAMEPGYKRVS